MTIFIDILDDQSMLNSDFDKLGMSAVEIFLKAGLIKSVSDGRRQIKNSALRFDDEKLYDPFARIVYYENEFYVVQKF